MDPRQLGRPISRACLSHSTATLPGWCLGTGHRERACLVWPLRCLYPEPGAGEAGRAAMGCQGGDVCLIPAIPPNLSSRHPREHAPTTAARTWNAHRCAAPVAGCHWVARGRKQNWLGLAWAALCPLIRCFRQGGGRGYSLPAHRCGVRQGQPAGPLRTPSEVHWFPFRWPSSPLLDDAEGMGPGELSTQGPAPPFSPPESPLSRRLQAAGQILDRGPGPTPSRASGQGCSLGRAGKAHVRMPNL